VLLTGVQASPTK